MREQPPADCDAPALDLSVLSPREREVLEAALEGLSARAMAARFSLTEATVRSHLSAIYSKLGVAGRVELLSRQNGGSVSATAASGPTKPAAADPILEGEAEPSPAVVTLPPKSNRRVALALVALLACGLVIAAIALIIQAGAPRASDLATVSRLLASGQVAQLDLVNSTLTVTEKSGERLRVESVASDAVQPILDAAMNASIPVSISGGSSPPPLAQLIIVASPLLEVALVAAAIVLLLGMVRRPPRVRPAR